MGLPTATICHRAWCTVHRVPENICFTSVAKLCLMIILQYLRAMRCLFCHCIVIAIISGGVGFGCLHLCFEAKMSTYFNKYAGNPEHRLQTESSVFPERFTMMFRTYTNISSILLCYSRHFQHLSGTQRQRVKTCFNMELNGFSYVQSQKCR